MTICLAERSPTSMAVWIFSHMPTHTLSDILQRYKIIQIGALVGAGGLIQMLQVLECDEFYGLGPEQVAALIASDTITVPNEEKVGILPFPPNFCIYAIIFRCLKALSPGFNTRWKLGHNTFPPSWSTSGFPCSARIISSTRSSG